MRIGHALPAQLDVDHTRHSYAPSAPRAEVTRAGGCSRARYASPLGID